MRREKFNCRNLASHCSISNSLCHWRTIQKTLKSLFLAIGIIIVGLYPALLLSSFNPALILKGKFSKSKSGVTLRQGLVGFQYIISIFLIAGTVAVSRQLDFMQTQDLGYTKDQVVVMHGPSIFDSTFSSQVSTFKNQVAKIASVKSLSAGSGVPGHLLPYPNSIRRLDQSPEEHSVFYPVGIDDQFFQTFEMPLVAGRNFEPDRHFYFSSLPQMTLMNFYQPPSRKANGRNEVNHTPFHLDWRAVMAKQFCLSYRNVMDHFLPSTGLSGRRVTDYRRSYCNENSTFKPGRFAAKRVTFRGRRGSGRGFFLRRDSFEEAQRRKECKL